MNAELARLGSATVYEAVRSPGAGRRRVPPVPARRARVRPGADRPLRPGRQPDGARRHGARVQPGDVLVLTMPEPAPVALLGDLLATQAAVRNAAAVLVDAAIRDSEELPLPVWARWVRNRGATKDIRGELDVPVIVGGATIKPGDLLVLDADGVTVVPAERAEEVLEASLAREANEADKRAKLEAGALSYELDGLESCLSSRISGRSSCSRRSGDESLAFFVDVMGMEIEAQDGPVDVPARLGRLPAVVAEADRVGHQRDGRPRPPGLEPRGARAPGRRDRGRGSRRRLDRRRPRPRAVVPLPRSRRASLRALLRVRALRPARPSAAGAEERARAATPAAAARSSASTTSTSSPPTCAPTASSASTRSATGSTSGSSSTTAPRPAPG